MSFPSLNDWRRLLRLRLGKRIIFACLLCAIIITAGAVAFTSRSRKIEAVSSAARQPVVEVITPTTSPRQTHVLRVCADPNNLPFSNQKEEGFENRIADLIAREMNARVEYTWWAQRRGFFRNTLKAGVCDVVIEVPSGFEMALTTAPFYRSTYVFVSRKDRHLQIHSLDDPLLREIKIGVQMVGDDFSNTPPAHALSERGIISNVKGYTLYGDYSQENPQAKIVEAVAEGKIDVAIVWGPLAGYFAKRQRHALQIDPVTPQIDQSFLPLVFDMSIGVRRGSQTLRDELEEILERKKPEIEAILDQYGVPRLDPNASGESGHVS